MPLCTEFTRRVVVHTRVLPGSSLGGSRLKTGPGLGAVGLFLKNESPSPLHVLLSGPHGKVSTSRISRKSAA